MSMDQHELSNALHTVRQVYETLTNKAPSEKVINSWMLVLEPLDYDITIDVLTDWLKTQTFPPKPADIINAVQARKTTQAASEPTEDKYDVSDMNSPYMKRLLELMAYSDAHLPPPMQNVRILLWKFLNPDKLEGDEHLDRFQYDYLLSVGAIVATDSGYQLTGKFEPAKAKTWAEESGALDLAEQLGILGHIKALDKGTPKEVHDRYFDARGNAIFPANDPSQEEDIPF